MYETLLNVTMHGTLETFSRKQSNTSTNETSTVFPSPAVVFQRGILQNALLHAQINLSIFVHKLNSKLAIISQQRTSARQINGCSHFTK